MAADLVISTAGALKFIKPAHEFDCCAEAQLTATNAQSMFLTSCERIMPRFSKMLSPKSPKRIAKLFGQHESAIDLKVPTDRRCAGSGLASADGHCVLAFRHDDVTEVGHHAQITRAQVKPDFLTGARFQIDTLKSA